MRFKLGSKIAKGRNPCICLNIKTGAALIGVFELVLWSVIMSVTSVNLYKVSGLMDDWKAESELKPQYPDDSEMSSPEVNDLGQSLLRGIFVALISLVAVSVVRIVNGTFLILGIVMNSTILVTIWIGVKILSFVLTMGFFVTALANGTATFELDVIYAVSVIVTAYFLWVVIAMHGVMEMENHPKSHTKV